jgi:putative ABC transport system permease protein
VDPGYDPNHLLTFQLGNLRPQTPDGRAQLIGQLRSEIGALPGVQAVAAANPLPLDGATANMPWGTESTEPTAFQQAQIHVVQPGYFEAMKGRLVDGRTFTDADNRLESTSIVIDHVLASKAFPGQRAVGRSLLLRVGGNSPIPHEIIGVVRHQRHATLAEEGRETIFFIDGSRGHGAASRWVVRTDGDPLAAADAVTATIRRVDSRLTFTDVQPMSAYVDRAQAPTRFALVLTAVFAFIAVVLAVVGLYGVLASTVRQRTAEIGVRMAFGAERAAIFRLIVGRGLLLAGIGIAIGVASGLGLTRAIASQLVGVQAGDPATFVGIGVLFLVVAAAACGIPAYRASRLDATTALRAE